MYYNYYRAGEIVGAKLVEDPRVAGVMFTGSTETAKHIQQTLANRPAHRSIHC